MTDKSYVPFGYKLLTMEMQDRFDFGIAMEGPTGSNFVSKWYSQTGIGIPGALFYRNGDTKPTSVTPKHTKFTRSYLREYLVQTLDPRRSAEGSARPGEGRSEAGDEAPKREGFSVSTDIGQLTASNLARFCPRKVVCDGNRCQAHCHGPAC